MRTLVIPLPEALDLARDGPMPSIFATRVNSRDLLRFSTTCVLELRTRRDSLCKALNVILEGRDRADKLVS